MKTEASEYLSLLQEIQNNNVSTFTVMPADEPRFTIETNSRNIIVPSEFSFLSVQNDHRAETIYFEIDRYFDNVDLSQHTCVVQFINKSGTTINEGTYPVISMDIDSIDGKIVFGWEIRNDATQLTGDITFSVRFYSIDNNGNFTYNFNTLTASSYILPSLNIIASGERITATELEVWTDKMNNLASSIESDIITVEEKIEELENYIASIPEDYTALTEEVSKLSEDIADIKQNGTGTGNGATTAQANSLWVIIQKSAFAQQLTDAEINEFKTTWGITEEVEPDTPTTYTITRNLTNCTSSSEVTSIDEGSAYTETITANNGYTLTGATVSVTMGDSDITSSYSNGVLNISSVTGNIVLTVSAVQETTEPDNPEVTLTSISATYTGGNVTVGTSVTDLTGITVTGTYSDGSTSTITGYTLSGEIVEGSNTITVSYGGKTTTFTVTGVAESVEPLYGTYWPPMSNVTNWSNPIWVGIDNYAYTGNSGEYVDAGFPQSRCVRLDKLQGTIYIRTLTNNQYGLLEQGSYSVYANEDGKIGTGGFETVPYTVYRNFDGETKSMVVNDTTYKFSLFKFEIPAGKIGYFVSANNLMSSSYCISSDKLQIDEEYKQYYTLFTSDPSDRITEGATEVNG